MQDTYSLKQAEQRNRQQLIEKSPELEEKQIKKSKDKNEVKETTTLSSEQVQQTIEEYDLKQTEVKQKKHGYGLRRLKTFREMDIEEKLDYLHQFPKQLPPVPCLFQTANKALRGLLLDKTDDHIVLRLLDKSEATVGIKDLIEIRMIGLN